MLISEINLYLTEPSWAAELTFYFSYLEHDLERVTQISKFIEGKSDDLDFLPQKPHEHKEDQYEWERWQQRVYRKDYSKRAGFISACEQVEHEYRCLVALMRIVANLSEADAEELLKVRLGIFEPGRIIFAAQTNLLLLTKSIEAECERNIPPEIINAFVAG